MENLVQWKDSKSYKINIAKLNIDKYPDIQNSMDSSPTAPFPHYVFFYNGMAVSFVGAPEFETVRDFIDNFIKKTSNLGSSQPPSTSTQETQSTSTTTDHNSATQQTTTQDATTQDVTTQDAQPTEPGTGDTFFYREGDNEYQVRYNEETGQYEYVFPESDQIEETFIEDVNGTESGGNHTESVDAGVHEEIQEGNENATHIEEVQEEATHVPTETAHATEATPQTEEVDEINVAVLDNNNFDQRIANGVWFIEFYAPWCAHCKSLKPTWAQLANIFQDDPLVVIGKIDATENEEIAQRFNIAGYPTLLFLRDGLLYDYDGERDIDSLITFIDGAYANAKGTPLPTKKTAPTETAPIETAHATEATPQTTELDESDVVVLGNSNFASSVSNGVWLIDFYAPWCGHCKSLKPIWAQIATELKSSNIKVAKVDVDSESDLSSLYEVRYLPTVFAIAGNRVYKYDGERERGPLIEFARGGYKTANSTELPKSLDESDIFVLTDSNYKDQISKGEWFIEFYAPWCGFCKKMKPTWAQLATKYKTNPNIKIAMSDATQNTELAEKFGVESYPTIYLFKNGRKYPFSGNRTVDGFSLFVESEWKQFEHKALPLIPPISKRTM